MRTLQNPNDDNPPQLKAIATGARRKWDARLTPEMTANFWKKELAKAPWLVHVAVLENGEIISQATWRESRADAVRAFYESPCAGFVGGLWADKEKQSVRFFTKQLRVSPKAREELDRVVQLLGNQIGERVEKQIQANLRNALK